MLRSVRVSSEAEEATKEVAYAVTDAPAAAPTNGSPSGALSVIKDAAVGVRATLALGPRRPATASKLARMDSGEGSLRGSDRQHRNQTLIEQELVATAAKEEKAVALDFPEGTWLVNPNGRFFKWWSGAMIPAILYAAVVSPFEIAFISGSCDLLAPNLVRAPATPFFFFSSSEEASSLSRRSWTSTSSWTSP